MLEISKNTVLLFGSFDGIHPGHKYLVAEARKYSSQIVIVVAQDSVIQSIKKRPPINTLNLRIQKLKTLFKNIIVVAGDNKQGTWSAIRKYQPEIIIIGYDQHNLHKALINIQEEYGFKIITTKPFHPEKYKSSILRKKKNL